MDFVSNEGKKIEIQVGNDIYLRHAIKTRFITSNDNYIDIIKEYKRKRKHYQSQL